MKLNWFIPIALLIPLRLNATDAAVGAGEDPLPSCSAAEALERQEPFINQVLATSALAMLARLFRYGVLSHHGAFFNAATGRMAALPVDPQMWEKLRRQNRNARSRVEKKSR